MKYAVLAGLLMAQAAAAENKVEDTKQYIQIVEGFLKGTLDAEGFDDIEHCFQDGENIFKDAEKAYTDFSKKTASGAIDGIKDIADILTQIQHAMKDCDVKGDWAKLLAIANEFKSPMSFVYHVGKDLIHNGVQIFEEVHTAVDDYEQGKWEDFGYQCGMAAAKTFLGQEGQEVAKRQKAALVQQGFYKAFGLTFDLEALLFCIYDEDQALLFLDVAYQALQEAIHSKTTGDVIGNLIGTAMGVVGAYQQFEQGLPVCEQVFANKNMTPVQNSMSFVSNPLSNLGQMTKNIQKYEADIMLDLQSAAFHYQMEDYEKFGEFLGNLVKLASTEQVEAKPMTSWADVYPHDNRDMVTEIMQGFLEASNVGTFNFTNLLICIYQEDQAAIALYEGVETLEEAYKDKDWNEAIGGVIALVASFQAAEQGLPVCEAVVSSEYNWTEFDKLAKLTMDKEKTVKVIEKNLMFNGVAITEEFIQAMEEFTAGNYKTFGSTLGKAMYDATKVQEENLFLY